MKVREIMRENPICCTIDSSVQQISRLMNEHNYGFIPVVNNEISKKPLGIITDRDIAIRAFNGEANPLEMKAANVMTSNVVKVTTEMSVEECLCLMQEKDFRRVLVIDENGCCCGIVEQADITGHVLGRIREEVLNMSASVSS